ncbi:MAG: SurA N-terminal domain-containing protein [Candidatus Woesearchaeota archaeon]
MKYIHIFLLGFAAIFLVACGTETPVLPDTTPVDGQIPQEQIQTQIPDQEQIGEQPQIEMQLPPQPELPDVDPSTVVATVNGQEITQEQVNEVIIGVMQQQGQQISSQEALEQVIYMQLLMEYAQEQSIVVSREQAEAFLAEQLEPMGQTLEEYEQAIVAQGVDLEIYYAQVQEQLAVEQIFDQLVIEPVAEEEIRAFYEQNLEFIDEEVTYEQIRPEIEMLIEQNRLEIALNEFLLQLQESAQIEMMQ